MQQQFWALNTSGCQSLNSRWVHGLSSGPEPVPLCPSAELYLFQIIFKYNSVITFLWTLWTLLQEYPTSLTSPSPSVEFKGQQRQRRRTEIDWGGGMGGCKFSLPCCLHWLTHTDGHTRLLRVFLDLHVGLQYIRVTHKSVMWDCRKVGTKSWPVREFGWRTYVSAGRGGILSQTT